jgi:hypothetical protein
VWKNLSLLLKPGVLLVPQEHWVFQMRTLVAQSRGWNTSWTRVFLIVQPGHFG